MKRAIISVTDKKDIVDFTKGLIKNNFEIISTGGTYDILKAGGVPALKIEDITDFPEILDGRVKTLNPYIHGGILFRRDNSSHLDTVSKLKIGSIDLVCVNLYDFKNAVDKDLDEGEVLEEIDIGGPTLIRAGAKNYKDVLVVTDTGDYKEVIDRLEEGKVDIPFKRSMAAKAFKLIAAYDNQIAGYFNADNEYISMKKMIKLSYGENPHQEAYLYKKDNYQTDLMDFKQLWGKDMSYNNYGDAFAALELLADFKDERFFSASIKHGTVCGAAGGENPLDSYEKCLQSDAVAIFGGILGMNFQLTSEVAEKISQLFLEIIIAPSYSEEAIKILTRKKNIRILQYDSLEYGSKYQLKDLDGYILKQERDMENYEKLSFVTEKKPLPEEMNDLLFANKIVKNIKSNGIAIVRNRMLLAVGGGQTARVYALKNAADNSSNDLKGSFMSSDAFFPFNDSVEYANKMGIKGIIQPGGSKNDQLLIEYCNKNNLVMVFTNRRHFKH